MAAASPICTLKWWPPADDMMAIIERAYRAKYLSLCSGIVMLPVLAHSCSCTFLFVTFSSWQFGAEFAKLVERKCNKREQAYKPATLQGNEGFYLLLADRNKHALF